MPYNVPSLIFKDVNGSYRSWENDPLFLDAESNSIGINGQLANLKYSRRLLAERINFNLTGQNANLLVPQSNTLLFSDSFDSGIIQPHWNFNARSSNLIFSTNPSDAYGGTGRAVYTVDVGGEVGSWPTLGHRYSQRDLNCVGIRFRAKKPVSPRYGEKFWKIHGQEIVAGSYANTTFGTDYSNGNFNGLSMGDGTGAANDTQKVLRWGNFGTKVSANWRGGQPTVVFDRNQTFTWDTDWHLFEMVIKFNDRNGVSETRNGYVKVKIDGQWWYYAHSFFNTHISNPPIDLSDIFGVTYPEGPTQMWYDDVDYFAGDFLGIP